MTDSRIPAALDKLVSIIDAGTAADVRVYDGPFITGANPTRRVYVGYDGDPEGEWVAVSSDQSWAGTLGTARRDEEFSITGAVVVQDGTGNVKAARDAAYAVFADVSTAVRADPSLGFPPPTVAQVRNPALSYAQTATSGVEARVAFTVDVTTRI